MRYIKQEGVGLTWINERDCRGLSRSQRSLYKLDLDKELKEAGIKSRVKWGFQTKRYIVIEFKTPEDEAYFILFYCIIINKLDKTII